METKALHRRGRRDNSDLVESGDVLPYISSHKHENEAFLTSPRSVSSQVPSSGDIHDAYPEWIRQREREDESNEKNLPTCMKSGWFIGFFVLLIILVALSPIIFEVRRESAELDRRRYHNNSFREKNPTVASLTPALQWNYYCHASFPGALDSLNYTSPGQATLISVQIVTRHGDRAPCNVLPHEGNITWFCNDPDPYDPAFTPIKLSHVRDEPDALRPNDLWSHGNCAACDLTGRGLVQHYMLGEALGAIYSQYISISPDAIYVRSTDTARARQSAEAFIRGLLTVAVESGTVNLLTAVTSDADIMRPQPSRCPALKAAFQAIEKSEPWKENLEKHSELLESLKNLLDIRDTESFKNALEWSNSFDHLFDNIQSRHCHGLSLPCRNADFLEENSDEFCVNEDQRLELYDAASWEFRHRFGGSPSHNTISRLGSGALVNQLLENFNSSVHSAQHLVSTNPTKGKVFFLYSGHDDTIAGLLSSLHVKGWNWPPYASNLIWELWKDDTTGEPFVRIIYNGKVLALPFCSQNTCLLEEFQPWLMAHVVPEDMKAECQGL